jgi:hypothetical protein
VVSRQRVFVVLNLSKDRGLAERITVVTATSVETRAARKALPDNVRVVQCGVGANRAPDFGDVAISCGLAGGLRPDLPTGTVAIPQSVRRPDGTTLICDRALSDLLRAAARSLGHNPIDAPLLTSTTLVHGNERTKWAADYAAVDMETGLISAPRIACVRVILDTPKREISAAWLNPARAFLSPAAWRDLPFLALHGQPCASLAAQIIAAAINMA